MRGPGGRRRPPRRAGRRHCRLARCPWSPRHPRRPGVSRSRPSARSLDSEPVSVTSNRPASAAQARAAIGEAPMWYHSIEVASGVVTPGWFDLRGIVGKLPWPDVRGKRCLDVGTSDGFLAFELERRGAAEVVALDIGGHEEWDWEAHL